MSPAEEKGSRPSRVAVLLVVAAALAWFGPFFTVPLVRLVDDWSTLPIADDAFYFLQIARHVALGHGSTFDGVHATDGYQPLWLCLLAGLQWLLGTSPEGLCRAALATTCLLLGATGVQCALFARDAGLDRRRAALLGIGVVLWSPLATSYGTLCEAALNGFLFVATLRAAAAVFDAAAGRRGEFGFGLLLGLLFLARLDNFLLVGVLLLAVLGRRGRAAVPALLRIAACAAPLGIGYLAFQVLVFGHLMPISGAVKSMRSGPIGWSDPSWWIERLQARLGWFLQPSALAQNRLHVARALAAASVLALALPVRWWLAHRPGAAAKGHALALWCAVLSFVPKHLYYAIAQGMFNEAQWYYAPELLTLALFLGLWWRCRTWPLSALLAAVVVWSAWPEEWGRAFADGPFLLWNAAPALVLLLVALVLLLRGAPLRHRLAAAVVPLLLVLALPGRDRLWHSAPYTTEKGRLAELGRWAHEVRLCDHGTAGAYSSGLVNYFAGGAVTNLDGLVADWEWYALAQQRGRIPPPRGETFVLDYHPVPKQGLLEHGYALCLDELPAWVPGARGRRSVFVVTNDLDKAQQVYLDVLARPDADRVLRAHAAGVAFRLQLPRVLAALGGDELAPAAVGAATTATLHGGAVLFVAGAGGGPEAALAVAVDGREVARVPGNDGNGVVRAAIDLGAAAGERHLQVAVIGSSGVTALRCSLLRLVVVP